MMKANVFKDGVGRKFFICMVFQLVHCVMLADGVLDLPTYQTLTMFLLGGYVAGNVAERMVKQNGS